MSFCWWKVQFLDVWYKRWILYSICIFYWIDTLWKSSMDTNKMIVMCQIVQWFHNKRVTNWSCNLKHQICQITQFSFRDYSWIYSWCDLFCIRQYQLNQKFVILLKSWWMWLKSKWNIDISIDIMWYGTKCCGD